MIRRLNEWLARIFGDSIAYVMRVALRDALAGDTAAAFAVGIAGRSALSDDTVVMVAVRCAEYSYVIHTKLAVGGGRDVRRLPLSPREAEEFWGRVADIGVARVGWTFPIDHGHTRTAFGYGDRGGVTRVKVLTAPRRGTRSREMIDCIADLFHSMRLGFD